MIDNELRAALTKLDESVRELEKDYKSRPEHDQQDHLYHALMIVLDRFVDDDEGSSITMVTRAIQSMMMIGQPGLHGGPFQALRMAE